MGNVDCVTEASDRFRANTALFNERVEAVPPDRWESQSPCEDWKARDVVRHVVGTYEMFLGFVDEKAPPGLSTDDDPVGAFHKARDAVQRALDTPALAQKEYDGMFGRVTFEDSVNRFLASDALVHTWDLARAAGLDDTLPPDECERVLQMLAPLDDKMRTPGGFHEKIDPPQADDPQTRLLNFVGRPV